MAEKVTNRTERAVKGTLMSFLQYGTQMLLQAFLAPLVLRIAGQETLGAYVLLVQVVGYLAMVDFGFSVTLNRYLAHANGYEDGGKRFREVLSTARTFQLGSNLLFALLVLLVSLNVNEWFSLSPAATVEAREGLLLIAIWGVARTPWAVYNIGLNATQNLVAANFIGILGNASRLIFSLGLVFFGMGLIGLMLANILSEVLGIVLSKWQFHKLYPQHRPVWGIPDRPLFREMLRFSSQAFLINIAWRLVYYTDNIIIGYLYGAAAVSIYYTTQMPTTIGFNIANRLSDNASPAINELYAQRDDTKLRSVFLRLHRMNFLLVLPLVGAIILLNRQLISLWVGAGQYAGDSMTLALAAFALLITVSHVSGTFIFASGLIKSMSTVAILEGVCNLVLSIWLGSNFGLAGVMWATVIANFPATVFVVALTMRRMKVGVTEYLRACVFPSISPIISGYVAGYLTGIMMPERGWINFVLQGIVLIFVYCGFAYRMSLSREERAWIDARVMRIVSPITSVQNSYFGS